ncbi:MAG: 4Fe-4S binding protein [candidate division Zixibacteria bacterium]|nr:4Fe-4S binding protein [candidate division Zixibacteria bacterium]
MKSNSVWLNYIPLVFSILLLMAHFLRADNYGAIAFWGAVPFVLLLRKAWATRVLQLLLAIGAIIWIKTAFSIAQVRLEYGESWLRMALILAAVSSMTIWAALTFQKSNLRERFLPTDSVNKPSIIAFMLTAGILAIAYYKVSFPIIITERILPGTAWVGILILGIYAGWITEKLLDRRQTHIWRKRIWIVFSAVFFSQLLLGLLGLDRFLMTGDLHLPVPAMIIAGPLFRGEGLFMPILFLSTLLLVGPAWCSYLCYIGSWDYLASTKKRKPKPLPKWSCKVRWLILILIPLVALSLRLSGVPTVLATLSGIAFGLAGVALMLLWSSRVGAMTHCVIWCPIGLVANWLGKISPFRIRIDDSCDECGACSLACRYDALNIRDIQNRKPSLSCTLCGDCLKRCQSQSIGYRFLKLNPETARVVFITMVAALHAAFLGVARI